MGGTQSVFTEDELDDYQTLTYLSKKEILLVHKRFKSLDPAVVEADKNAKLPIEKIRELPELKVNPFKDQICKVFSSSPDGMTFEDFLDMMSVFSDGAPKSVKVEYAFRVYDFDGDDMISDSDLKQVIESLIGSNHLTEDEMQQLIDSIMEEADLDDDKTLSFAEFEHVISKAPDFVNSFRIRM
ncbi:calcium and integrin-binding protein 1-like [Physella acuta]|uniref:calcium and integrin-binding protein 1-like n=1 Tax=Physella acuta TaxID=109671 RepID=UPI0027DC240B|nr:calcium and integrin-binding protein 1-like [Physella acuta]XP_059151753.1 calcium and integrin-binding protein 1-like [Physella acuta]XP_059151754.1 calcium and integrin-binding protein 1-like [Physella acuta]XP_059151755.1 calcium and integrin-binding protein 1-like [Physella acuta]XP_059151756.1 calcium and integrin-binding protein 1-like [Physella acuta]XP_059151757.1 calcium and integrin-binding protein 1-like [Physella acuta]